jgi:hypothetical protein
MDIQRLPEIDWLKGFAILCGINNHSGATNGTWVYDHVISRAVPVFLVLFGMNAECCTCVLGRQACDHRTAVGASLYASSASSAFASFRSRVSKPSENQSYTG